MSWQDKPISEAQLDLIRRKLGWLHVSVYGKDGQVWREIRDTLLSLNQGEASRLIQALTSRVIAKKPISDGELPEVINEQIKSK